MIKVTTQNGVSYEFENADSWQSVGPAVAIYEGSKKIAEFASFLLVQDVTPPASQEPQA